jgi:predicted dehydrogenase
MQASSKSDLLIVTCSAESTRIVAEDVTKYPWTILFEKPIGLGIKEYEEINKLCLERNCKAYVALNRRYYSSTEKLIEMLARLIALDLLRLMTKRILTLMLRKIEIQK